MPTLRLAIAGVGNCASALLQGLEYYRTHDPARHERAPAPADRRLPARGPARRRRVRRRRAQGRPAARGGGLRAAELHERSSPRSCPTSGSHGADGPGARRRRAAHGALPGGARVPRRGRRAASTSRRCCARAAPRCSSATCRSAPSARSATTPKRVSPRASRFVNCVPVFIASDPSWAERFRAARLPIVGDDIKSQVGATIVHRTPRAPARRSRRRARRDLPAQHRRQHRLPQHARARAAREQAHLEDRVGAVAARRAPRRRATSTSARPTTSPGRRTTRSASSAWSGAASATCR